MQSENYGYHKTPRRGEVFEYVEKAKPGMAHEADEDQLSQPSTMQSLGNVDSTPEKTPTSEGWSNIKGDIKQKAGELKGKFVEKFGDEIQPEKDLDSDVKENIKEINEEIRHQPHGEEEVVEGQGQAKFKKDFLSENRQSTGQSGSESQDLKDISREILDKALNKIDDMRSKASQQGEQLKQGASEASSKISETVEQKSEFSSHTKVEVEKGSEPLTKDNKEEILELAQQLTDKIQELKTAGQLSSTQQSSQFSEQQKQTQNSSEESHEHHHLSAESRSFKPTQESHELVEKVKEGLEEHVPLTEVVEEFDHEKHPQSQERGQPTLDKLQQGAQNISNKLSGKVEEVKSKLNAPRQEESGFSQERRSEEQERPRENLQSQQQSGSEERGQPAFDKLQQGAENLSNKLSGKVEEVKNKFNAPEQERGSEERGQSSQSQQPKRFTTPEVTGEFKHKPNFEEAEGEIPSQSEEKSSTVESLKQNVQDVSNKISDKVQEVKDSIKERKEGGSEEKAPEEGSQQEEQSKERIPLVDQVMGRIKAVNDNINSKIESVKNAFKIEETTDERQPLVDVVSGRLNDFSSKISHGIETVKSKVTPSHKEAPAQKEQEMPKSSEKGPSLKERISGSYQNMSYQMSENLHNLKDRLRPEQDATKKFHKVDSDEGFNPETVKEFKEEKRLQELGGHELVSDNPFEPITVEEQPPTYFQKLKGKFVKENEEDEQIKDIEPVEESAESAKEGRSLRQAVNDNLESIKGKFRFGKDKAQEAGEEVSESKPLEEASESLEKKGEELSEPVKEESRSLRQAINDNLESVKGKFRFGKDKTQEAGEEISESKPLEEKGKELASSLPQESQLKEVIDQNMENIQSKYRFMKEKGQEELNKPLEESTEPLKEEGKSLKERISGGLKNLSGKIPHPVDSLKSKLRSGKEEPQQEEIEPLDESSEPVQEEESQPEEASKPSMKERLAGTFEGLKSKFASGKGKSEEEGQEKEGEFHTVTEGTTETISQLKEEERIEPLLSNNPFEPLETKDTNLAQPLEGSDLVGGDLKELTSNENPSFKVEESSEGDEKIQNVSFFQKVKANIMSAFNHENKENEATQGDKNE